MIFLGQYEEIHNYKTTTMKHILIRAPPPYRVQTASSLCPPLGGVWPLPRSGILVYLPPGGGHPLTPFPPPPPHQVSRALPLFVLFVFDNARSFPYSFLLYHMHGSPPSPPYNSSLDTISRGAARGHRPHMPMTPVCTITSRVSFRWWNSLRSQQHD